MENFSCIFCFFMKNASFSRSRKIGVFFHSVSTREFENVFNRGNFRSQKKRKFSVFNKREISGKCGKGIFFSVKKQTLFLHFDVLKTEENLAVYIRFPQGFQHGVENLWGLYVGGAPRYAPLSSFLIYLLISLRISSISVWSAASVFSCFSTAMMFECTVE